MSEPRPYEEEEEKKEESVYGAELDRKLRMYENAIQMERYYICNATLKCGQLYQVHCGLSSARNFELAVKIEYKPDNTGNVQISLSTFERPMFVNHLKWFRFETLEAAAAASVASNVKLTCDENIEISGLVCDGIKFVTLSNGHDTFYFTQQEMQELVRIDSTISFRIEILSPINCLHYYNNVLDTICVLLKNSKHIVSPIDVLKSFYDITSNSIEAYCLRECLYFNIDKVG
ncbi:unnamed protein product [Acanthoscelides obtectus]|uniref:Uncharacterized protein n=1 Tax=Acanthoscelides obtectus TaxID=200917 RepID=A0A9P0Q6H8_ACAOB|nr:unnamed protein product [Acanthoscelides obtectus]CAK1646644.1 hypothetical protein AOBTE_LOCUS14777 [Acanthoscelides obtectus]